jgi:pimeloyl-ACP methyl ester carboxylesterase
MFPYYRQQVNIPTGEKVISGNLTIPVGAKTIVIFAQAGGHADNPGSPVLEQFFQKAGFATLVTELTPDDGLQDRDSGVDVDLLTRRLIAVTEWIINKDLRCVYSYAFFASGIGAAAAIQAEADLRGKISAVVCCSGRLELVTGVLRHLEVPTLLIAGALDRYIVSVNKEAFHRLPGHKGLEIIDHTTGLWTGGALDKVAAFAGHWFAHFVETPVAEVLAN